jgi:hypothetical protein
MRKLTILAFAATIAFSPAVLADEVTGEITAIDKTAMTITLDDGKTYSLAWAEGQTVKIMPSTQPEEQGVIKGLWSVEEGAVAGEGEVVGVITDFDADQGLISLTEGKAYRWTWDVGSPVKVTYETRQEGGLEVTAIESAN